MSMKHLDHIALIATVAANVKWLSENIEGGIELNMPTEEYDGADEGIRPECSLMFQDWDMRSLADYYCSPGPFLTDLQTYDVNRGKVSTDPNDPPDPEEIPKDLWRYIDEDKFKSIQSLGGPWEIEFQVRRNPMLEQLDESTGH